MSRSASSSKLKSTYQNLEAEQPTNPSTSVNRAAHDRLQVLEDFFYINPTQSHSIDLRLKTIEEKLLVLEAKFPQIANEYLNYSQQGSHRSTGRTSSEANFYAHKEESKKTSLFDQSCKTFVSELEALSRAEVADEVSAKPNSREKYVFG